LAAIIPRRIVRATRAISAAEIAGEATAATEVAAVIDAGWTLGKDQDFDLAQQRFLDSIQSVFAGSLELLEKTVFPFASRRGLKYRWLSISRGFLRLHDCLFLQRP
jgi:hypothetical protein